MIMQDEKKITHIVTRGQVWLADLGANVGSEQSGIRPVLVIQNNKGCKYSSTFTICPLTSKKINKHLPTHVILKNEIFLPEISVALIEQTRTIDRGRFIKMLGTTNDNIMIEIDKAIKVHMGLLNEFSYDEAYELLEQIKDI
ncbi:MAG TPA: type II toxin-antitoxin system PemK/MazF family toxin, partial [Gallicola sp.]|nr:type II toxin-antitoxin system PemK/MazF family toxin [Gallicola sp.]